ncbi:MAG TPA: ABC transporter ATP-binding protein [Symbiobacteriaceae bacterium]|jgi:branched-chain amino acid transport system ATP-binding protein
MEYILETQDLTVQFGGLVAVDHVSLKVRPGTFQSIIGPNGAGKTTLFNLICGIYKPTAGRVIFRGREITGLPPHRVSQLGLGRSFQITNIFPNLTVLENVRLAVQSRSNVGYRLLSLATSFTRFEDRAREILAQVNLDGKDMVIANTLPHGDKRKLEIGMLLATESELLLLDEPTAGMSHADVPAVIEVIEKIKATGKTILLVEHKMDLILSLSDMVTVLKNGAVIAEGIPGEIAADPAVRAAYLGGMAV